MGGLVGGGAATGEDVDGGGAVAPAAGRHGGAELFDEAAVAVGADDGVPVPDLDMAAAAVAPVGERRRRRGSHGSQKR